MTSDQMKAALKFLKLRPGEAVEVFVPGIGAQGLGTFRSFGSDLFQIEWSRSGATAITLIQIEAIVAIARPLSTPEPVTIR